MNQVGQAQIAPVTVARDLKVSDLGAALAAGWGDFKAYPGFGLFFAAIYVAAGIFLYYALVSWGEVAWLVPAAAGFPLLAPFAAVGLYEVSRRRETGQPMSWRSGKANTAEPIPAVVSAAVRRGDSRRSPSTVTPRPRGRAPAGVRRRAPRARAAPTRSR